MVFLVIDDNSLLRSCINTEMAVPIIEIRNWKCFLSCFPGNKLLASRKHDAVKVTEIASLKRDPALLKHASSVYLLVLYCVPFPVYPQETGLCFNKGYTTVSRWPCMSDLWRHDIYCPCLSHLLTSSIRRPWWKFPIPFVLKQCFWQSGNIMTSAITSS